MQMASAKSLQINRIELKQFRCFTHQTLDLQAPLVLVEGPNGVGKTSLLEAIHYACYLRSFRTHSPRELTHFDGSHFFINVDFTQCEYNQLFDHQIQVGFTQGNRRVKVDQKNVASYKDLMSHYRVISLTEQDVALISGSPSERRLFLDHVILLINPEYLDTLRSFRSILSNRNALLHQHAPSFSMYEILSQQLWDISKKIRTERVRVVTLFEKEVGSLIREHVPWGIELSYVQKDGIIGTFSDFFKRGNELFEQEQRMRRSLMGAHLDDLVIRIKDRHSRRFASRGEQKLIILLLKVAQLKELALAKGGGVFLLDDFMTDFDEQRTLMFLDMLQGLDAQLIFTTPTRSYLYSELKSRNALISSLTY